MGGQRAAQSAQGGVAPTRAKSALWYLSYSLIGGKAANLEPVGSFFLGEIVFCDFCLNC